LSNAFSERLLVAKMPSVIRIMTQILRDRGRHNVGLVTYTPPL
jgi:hypothetical protein